MEYNREEIKERIEEIMRERGLTNAKLAEEVSISATTVSSVLRSNRSPTALLEKMSKTYGLSITWLLSGIGTKYNTDLRMLDMNTMDAKQLSMEDRAKMLSDINTLYNRHQDLLSEASNVMKQIVELNKILLLNNVQ